MPAGSLFKSTAVRLASLYIALFVIAYLLANIAAYQMVVRFLDDRLNANVMERYREITSAYAARGLQGAVQMIESHGPAIRGEETLYTLLGARGEPIAGNTDLSGVPNGFSTLRPEDQHESTSPYKLFKGPLGDNDLIVGISYDDTDQLAHIILTSFGWATAVILAVGMTGAGILAYRTRRRILALSHTAHAIGHGALAKRLPVSSRMDDIDILSSEVNVALARLELSVISLKQVSTDIAHDLKTPIGRTFLMLEDALQSDGIGEMRTGVEAALAEDAPHARRIADHAWPFPSTRHYPPERLRQWTRHSTKGPRARFRPLLPSREKQNDGRHGPRSQLGEGHRRPSQRKNSALRQQPGPEHHRRISGSRDVTPVRSLMALAAALWRPTPTTGSIGVYGVSGITAGLRPTRSPATLR